MSSDAERDVDEPYDDADDVDSVEWSRDWEWPAWLRPAWQGWRPEPRTLGMALALMFAPFLVSSFWGLRLLVDRLFATAPDPFSATQLVPTWDRIYDGAALFQAGAEAAVILGGVIVFLGRTRLGAWLLAAGLAVDAATHAVIVVVYFHVGPVPTESMARALANLGSRLVLLAATVLLLLRRPAPALAAGAEEPAPLPAG